MYIYFMLKERNIMLKTEFMEKLRLFSEELKTLGNFLESGFVWHFSDNDLLMNVLQEQCEHADPYCRMIKGNPYRKLNRCIHFHHDESFRKLRLSPGFRIAECHAGVKTLAVGMTVSGVLKGVLFVGPFAGETKRLVPLDLPSVSDRKLSLLGDYLKQRMDHLFDSEWLPGQEKPLLTQLPSSDRRILAAANYMRDHCYDWSTAKQAAEVSGLSVSRFLHLFRTETGYSFSDWLQRLRVARACRLLEESPYKLAEIAEIAGIRDQSRMTVLFRRYLNTTPGEYRASSRRENAAKADA